MFCPSLSDLRLQARGIGSQNCIFPPLLHFWKLKERPTHCPGKWVVKRTTTLCCCLLYTCDLRGHSFCRWWEGGCFISMEPSDGAPHLCPDLTLGFLLGPPYQEAAAISFLHLSSIPSLKGKQNLHSLAFLRINQGLELNDNVRLSFPKLLISAVLSTKLIVPDHMCCDCWCLRQVRGRFPHCFPAPWISTALKAVPINSAVSWASPRILGRRPTMYN